MQNDYLQVDDFDLKDFDDDDVSFEPEPDEPTPIRKYDADPRLEVASKILKQLHQSMGHVIDLLEGGDSSSAAGHLTELITSKNKLEKRLEDVSGHKIIEGVFDGQTMVGSDGKVYTVPPNYASKSRLVEGDMLKLTIKPDGSFVFKQIGPIDRTRITAKLAVDASTGDFVAIDGEDAYKLLTASVTYYRGQPGDGVVILVPKGSGSVWAAVENVVS